MKLDLLTNATVVDDAIRFICKNKEGLSDNGSSSHIFNDNSETTTINTPINKIRNQTF